MKTLLPLLSVAILLAACGRQDQPQRSEDSSATPAPDTPTTPSAVTPPASDVAAVQLAPTQGNTATGSLSVAAEGDGVRITGSLQGLKPDAEFGFHIHEKGDCSAPDASSAGEHFNPSNAQHGDPSGDAHHAGDMLNAKSDADGRAKVDVQARGVTLNSGLATDALGKAVVLHEKADDYATQPSGNSGARIACGVITG